MNKRLIYLIDFCGKVLKKLNIAPKVCRTIFNFKDKLVFKYISKYKSHYKADKRFNNEVKLNSVIWTGWLQGIDEAPALIKFCINNLISKAGSHKVIVITLENLNQYLPDFPQSIVKKYQNKDIIPAHFMDIIRVGLISKYGGLWIDPTVLITKEIKDSYFEDVFYTYKGHPGKWHSNPADSLWCTFYMGGKSGNVFFEETFNLLINYWSNNKVAIDYFLLDYVMRYIYNEVAEVADMVNKVSISEQNVFSLNNVLLMKYTLNNMKILNDKIKEGQVFKLTYKKKIETDTLMSNLIKSREVCNDE